MKLVQARVAPCVVYAIRVCADVALPIGVPAR